MLQCVALGRQSPARQLQPPLLPLNPSLTWHRVVQRSATAHGICASLNPLALSSLCPHTASLYRFFSASCGVSRYVCCPPYAHALAGLLSDADIPPCMPASRTYTLHARAHTHTHARTHTHTHCCSSALLIAGGNIAGSHGQGTCNLRHHHQIQNQAASSGRARMRTRMPARACHACTLTQGYARTCR